MAKMSTLMLTTAAVAVIFFQMPSSAQSQSAVTCYQCTGISGVDDNCGDSSFKTNGMTTCSGYQCFKTTASVTVLSATTTTTSRGCLPTYDDTSNNKCTNAGAGAGALASGSETTCYCNSNNCNAAAGIYPGRATGLLSLAAALIMAYISRRLL